MKTFPGWFFPFLMLGVEKCIVSPIYLLTIKLNNLQKIFYSDIALLSSRKLHLIVKGKMSFVLYH